MRTVVIITIVLLSVASVIARTAEEVTEHRQVRLAEFQERISQQISTADYNGAYCNAVTAHVEFHDLVERPSETTVQAIYNMAVSNGQTADCK